MTENFIFCLTNQEKEFRFLFESPQFYVFIRILFYSISFGFTLTETFRSRFFPLNWNFLLTPNHRAVHRGLLKVLIFLISILKLSFSLKQKTTVENFLTFLCFNQCTKSRIPFAHGNAKKISSKVGDFRNNFPRLHKLEIHIGILTQELSVSCTVLQMQSKTLVVCHHLAQLAFNKFPRMDDKTLSSTHIDAFPPITVCFFIM